jgi:RimJ/RimL family protein N-acetyltransferase
MLEAIKAVLEYLFDFGYEGVIIGYDEGNIKLLRN